MARIAEKDTADRILDAAERVLAEQPYAQISLRTLLSAAAVSSTAFYARFESKEAVVAALTARLFAKLHRAAPSALDAAKDLETGIERGVDVLCDSFAKHKVLVRLILSEAGGAPASIEARRTEYQLLAHFLGARLKGTHRDALAWALIGALEMQIVRWAVWDEIDLPTLRKKLVEVARAVLRKERS